jgi:hypothetical protein
MAARDNVAVKVSGTCTLSHERFPYKDIWDPLFRVFDAVAPEAVEEVAVGCEDLDALVRPVSDVELALIVERDAVRQVELALSMARLTPRFDEPPVACAHVVRALADQQRPHDAVGAIERRALLEEPQPRLGRRP